MRLTFGIAFLIEGLVDMRHVAKRLSGKWQWRETEILSRVLGQFSSVTQSCLTAIPWAAAHQASLSVTNSRSLLKLTSIELVMPSNHLILCHSLLLLSSVFPSIRIFSSESVLCIRWSKYWSFRTTRKHLQNLRKFVSLKRSTCSFSYRNRRFSRGRYPVLIFAPKSCFML